MNNLRTTITTNPNPNPNPNPNQAAKRHKEAEKARLTLNLYPPPISYPISSPYDLILEKARKPVVLMKDLEQRTILGVGTFGRVKLVRHNSPSPSP